MREIIQYSDIHLVLRRLPERQCKMMIVDHKDFTARATDGGYQATLRDLLEWPTLGCPQL